MARLYKTIYVDEKDYMRVDGELAVMKQSMPSLDWDEEWDLCDVEDVDILHCQDHVEEMPDDYIETTLKRQSACPGCGCVPGDGITESCNHPDGCGYFKENQ